MSLLRLERVGKRFGGLVALDDLSLEVERGSIVAVIGPNGAGKSTVFNLITGACPPGAGDIVFEGRSIRGLRPEHVTARGIARTFQSARPFTFVSALENVMTGEHARMRASLVDSLLHTPRQRAEERRVRERARTLLAFVGLERAAETYARHLAYADQRRLEIARALASGPRLLLLDEPGAGMNPKEKEALVALVARVRDDGVTIVLIEHDMRLVTSIAQHVVVLDHGDKIAEGPPSAVQRDPRVIEAYLGRAAEPA